MRIAEKLTYAAVIAVLAGCASWNPFSSKHAPKNPPAPLVEFKQSLAVRTAWSTSIGRAGAFVFTPAVTSDSVYAASADGGIARVDIDSGRERWRINAGAPLTAGVGSDGATIAVGAEKGVLMAFDSDGKLRWKTQASSEILSAPAVGQGLVVVRSVDNRIAAFDVDTGVRRWVAQRTSPPLTLRSAPGIVISGMTAYVALPGGRLAALALSNGGPRWEVAVGDPRGTTELERIADLSGSPVVTGRDVCAVAYQGRVACFDANTGATRWAKELSSDVGVGADDMYVYAADEGGVVTAFSRDTGSGAWRNNKLANRRLSTPVPVGRAVAVGDAQGYIHFLSRDDGALVARVNTDGSAVIAAVPLSTRAAIFQTQAGTLIALATE
ncbi:MAG TPA: outer membrane protein assembly factor BamB [Noviherbaspirillum sp.]|uniref:outer membrane protein assembly factor BamB n=1 Tax=Noviherbaspirillum sp. TaxID=1926288 RepID=UPI002B4929DC|nr:outer membrane protein assembly factor BamB [Noviherbaspirillum sp.]HJV85780.1 outer membrane protein assembly factor BamB [Noviherbaspirillum sp.]